MQLPYDGRCKITNLFGKAGAWFCGWHIGLDMVGIESKEVRAVAEGTVTGINVHGSRYGNSVEIKHKVNGPGGDRDLGSGNGWISFYAHLKTVKVRKGQSVKAGDVIGVEGTTGNVTGSHLHLEIHKGAYKYPAKGTSPAICPWLLDPCEVLEIEKKVGEVEESLQLSKVKIRVIPGNLRYAVDGLMLENTNYASLREVFAPLPFVEKVDWDNASKEVLIYTK